MIIDLPNGGKAKLIGDPHLGLKFETHVPLHRRGEREKAQFDKFVAALNTPGVRYNIMVGDLFEHPFVSHGTVVAAAEAFQRAAAAHPNTTFVALAGNHDRSRNTGVTGAWESFAAMVEDRYDNLFSITEPSVWDDFVFFPWDWSRGAEDQALDLIQEYTFDPDDRSRIAVGHWDLKSYGGDETHLAPTKVISAMADQIYGGHYHTPGVYRVAGHDVICTGSLEPYSHGEDPDEEIYVTRTLSQVLADPSAFKDKAVRVILAPGEDLPDIDCLALQPMKAEVEGVEIPEVQMDGFDWDAVLEHELAQVEDKEVVGFIRERL